MVSMLDNSTPGKRSWNESSKPGWSYDYGSTVRSTFPDWAKFFYVKTPKNKYLDYCIVDGPKPYEHEYFNGNTQELKRLLNNSSKGILSKSTRIQSAWIIAVSGFLQDIEDFEELYGEKYYSDEIYEDFPF